MQEHETSMTNAQLADRLQAGLKLDRPPVGLAYVDIPPAGVAAATEPAPSACTFWRRAEQGVFYAGEAEHYACPVGAMTQGFSLPESEQPRAMELVGTMVDLGYFSMDEVAHLPTIRKPHRGVVYGPLAKLPLPPDLVLLVVSPFQAMVLAESAGAMALGETPALAAMGRPACAALPRALGSGAPTLSLGCIGARTYAEIPEDRALVVLPADSLEQTLSRLDTLLHANQALATYHGQKKAGFPR
jgi:uncharacterized protein (DUF169 family)